MLRRLSFVFPLVAVGAALGCGSGISNRDNPSIATVSGQLSGSTVDVPAGAKVALVWRSPSGGPWVVSAEAPVVGGAFSFSLDAAPSDDLFFDPSKLSGAGSGSVYNSGSGGVDEPPTSGGSAPAPSAGTGGGSSSGGGGSAQIRPMDVASGTVSAPMTVAAAGFVLYVDKNGNGAFDIDANGYSPDTILGGSRDLALVYLRDGSSLDLEKLRDQTGQLPTRGYDLVLVSKTRWLSLSSVDLTLGDDRLPDGLCYMGGAISDTTVSAGPDMAAPPPTPPSLPSPGDPNLHCSADGRSYTYSECNPPPPPPPPPPGTPLCGGDTPIGIAEPCGGGGAALGPTDPVPAGWPCPVADATDAGVAMDGGKGP